MRTTPSYWQAWGSGKLLSGSPWKSGHLGITVWISTRHHRGKVENFLPAHLSRAEQGGVGVKVGGARAAASCLDFSLSFKSAARKLEVKFSRSLSGKGKTLPCKVCSSLLSGWVLQVLKAARQLSSVLVFAAGCASLTGRGGRTGVSQGPSGAKTQCWERGVTLAARAHCCPFPKPREALETGGR